ncbi:hypothetical protein, partial [Symbiobacterium thermophilum]|uniref:hypothetical protein n=1 Tax=Symbiobacterium thermophilum TaxID=2734 RepID=UPI002356807E
TRAFFCEEDIIQLAIHWKNRAASLCIFYCNSLHFLLAKNSLIFPKPKFARPKANFYTIIRT